MRALIFSGGKIGEGTRCVPENGDFIICADGGVLNCARFGLKPDTVIGDFDSACDYTGENAVRFKREKDETDTLLAVNHALGKGYKEIVIYGALGGRTDHELGNIYLLKKIVDSGAEGVIEDGKNKILLTDKKISIKRGGHKYLSVLPVFGAASGVCISGTKYMLDNFYMDPGATIGISNEITEEYADISVENGYLLILLCSD